MVNLFELNGAKSVNQVRGFTLVWFGGGDVTLYDTDDEKLATIDMGDRTHTKQGYAELYEFWYQKFADMLESVSDFEKSLKDREKREALAQVKKEFNSCTAEGA